MNTIRRALPTLLAVAAFAVAAYLYLSLRKIDAKLTALAPPATEPGAPVAPVPPPSGEQAARIRELEVQIAELRKAGAPGRPDPAAEPAPPAAARPPSAGAVSPGQMAEQEQAASKMMNGLRFQPPVLATPDGRKKWLGEIAKKAGFSPAQIAELARILEEEAIRRGEILAQQSAGLRSAREAWADLADLDQVFLPRIDRILDPEQQSAWHLEHARALFVPANPAAP